jgi:DNA modification methylase
MRLADATDHIVLGWFHRYPARFAADVVTSMLADVIARARRPIMSVLDPFCGTGTVVSAARQLGLSATGVELTPLGVLIGQLRLNPPRSPWDDAAWCERLANEPPAPSPSIDSRLTTWLGDHNARLLTAWLPLVADLDDARTRRFAMVAISQSLRPSSRWLVGSIKATIDPDRTPIPLDQSLRRWSRQLARDCAAEQDALARVCSVFRSTSSDAELRSGDARALAMPDASVDAIVTSPPYFITYDYVDVQRLSYLAFNWAIRRKDQVGAKYGHPPTDATVKLPEAFRFWYVDQFHAESTALGRALRAYVDGMRAHIAEAVRVVAPGGVVAYSLANTIRAGRVFDLVTGVQQLLEDAGFTNIEAVPRRQAGRRILPAGRDVASGRFSTDTRIAGVREHVVFAVRP